MYKTANMPGVAVGLAWTYVGGDILFIETTTSDNGKGELKLTGNLGNVMKESASTAMTYLQANAKKYGIDPELFTKKNVHIHIPEGAVPKDGPSAGHYFDDSIGVIIYRPQSKTLSRHDR